jgi:hypothetical protein
MVWLEVKKTTTCGKLDSVSAGCLTHFPQAGRERDSFALRTSRLPSFLDDTEHLYDDSLRCQHFSKLFDEGHKQVL